MTCAIEKVPSEKALAQHRKTFPMEMMFLRSPLLNEITFLPKSKHSPFIVLHRSSGIYSICKILWSRTTVAYTSHMFSTVISIRGK